MAASYLRPDYSKQQAVKRSVGWMMPPKSNSKGTAGVALAAVLRLAGNRGATLLVHGLARKHWCEKTRSAVPRITSVDRFRLFVMLGEADIAPASRACRRPTLHHPACRRVKNGEPNTHPFRGNCSC